MLQESLIGSYNFNVLRALLESLDLLKTQAGAEIGVFDGGTSWYLLRSFPQLRLFGVDPYLAYPEYDQSRMRQAEQTAVDRLAQFGERSIRIKESSVSAAKAIPEECLDFVFVDGDHTYDAVVEDIKAWYPKVHAGGLFCGHDYSWGAFIVLSMSL